MNILNKEINFKINFKKIWKHIFVSYIPNKADNIKQIFFKVLFLVSLVALIVSACYLADYFIESDRQNGIIDDSRDLWHNTVSIETDGDGENDEEALKAAEEARQKAIQKMLAENDQFKGWITIKGTKVDNPIYQAPDNDFYLDHNQQKKYSVYGALYFDCANLISEQHTDSNLAIYGHEMKDGSMFGQLKKYKSLDFYKEHPTIEFSTLYKSSTYKVYAVFLLNAVKEDDNNYIYNIYRTRFLDINDFNAWSAEAYERSVINTGVDVKYGDNIITLITCSEDFENARFVVMAREVREDEKDEVDVSKAGVNAKPRYPQKWYDKRKKKNPYIN
ncbi:MAG: class B sortase [Clostridia bacterium]|nr:class B sortase [Clostridia bacterium]